MSSHVANVAAQQNSLFFFYCVFMQWCYTDGKASRRLIEHNIKSSACFEKVCKCRLSQNIYYYSHQFKLCLSLFTFVVLPLKLLDRFHDTLIQGELAKYFSLLVALLERLLHNWTCIYTSEYGSHFILIVCGLSYLNEMLIY